MGFDLSALAASPVKPKPWTKKLAKERQLAAAEAAGDEEALEKQESDDEKAEDGGEDDGAPTLSLKSAEGSDKAD